MKQKKTWSKRSMVHFMVFIKDFVLKVLGKTMVKDHVDTKYTILQKLLTLIIFFLDTISQNNNLKYCVTY